MSGVAARLSARAKLATAADADDPLLPARLAATLSVGSDLAQQRAGQMARKCSISTITRFLERQSADETAAPAVSACRAKEQSTCSQRSDDVVGPCRCPSRPPAPMRHAPCSAPSSSPRSLASRTSDPRVTRGELRYVDPRPAAATLRQRSASWWTRPTSTTEPVAAALLAAAPDHDDRTRSPTSARPSNAGDVFAAHGILAHVVGSARATQPSCTEGGVELRALAGAYTALDERRAPPDSRRPVGATMR